ncbi:MAG: hypothetical protein ACLUKN_00225 [Bacilli bacterium]
MTRQQIETNTLQNVINSLQKRAETDKSINDELNNVRATLKQVKAWIPKINSGNYRSRSIHTII